jgi:hypothetical protein
MTNKQFEHMIDLLREAVTCLSRLKNQYEWELAPVFVKSLDTLQTPTVSTYQEILLLSSVRQRVSFAEKKVVGGLIHDDSLSSVEISDLVRVRLICHKLLNNLVDAIDNLKIKKT